MAYGLESELEPEESAPAKPVEYQPYEEQSQVSPEADQWETPPEQLKLSEEDTIRLPSPPPKNIRKDTRAEKFCLVTYQATE